MQQEVESAASHEVVNTLLQRPASPPHITSPANLITLQPGEDFKGMVTLYLKGLLVCTVFLRVCIGLI